jgi:hypothetical protein
MSHTKQLALHPKLFQHQNCRRGAEAARHLESVEELLEHDLEFGAESEVEKVEDAEKGVSPDIDRPNS